MRKRNLRAALLTAIWAVALCVATSLAAIAIDADRPFAVSRAPRIPETIFTGETFTPPEIDLTYKGQSAPASTRLIAPSGIAKSADRYTIDEPGQYTIEYFAKIGGFPVEERYTFIAAQHLYETDGKVKPYFGAPSAVPDRAGIVVTLGKGETFRYNRIIDFSDMTAQDPFIQMYAVPSTVGAPADARQIIYTLTDTEDENNVLTITMQSHSVLVDWSIPTTWVRAGATGQPQAGWDWWNDRLRSGDWWGCPVNYSMVGLPESGTWKTQTFNMQFDYRNLRLTSYYGGREIIKFDNPDYFDTLWGGFTRGTAYLSISCNQFNAPSTTFVLTDVAGHMLADGDTVMIRDTDPPTVEIEATESVVPPAVIGTPYPLYAATAYDVLDKAPTLTRRVFINYGSNMQAEYEVTDGAFTPDRAGVYTVEYAASDYFGNRTIKTIEVTAAPRLAPLTVTPSLLTTTGTAGESLSVGDCVVTGAIGNFTLEITAQCEYDGQTYRYPVRDGAFRPEYAGTYTITYTVTDYIGSASAVATATVGKSNVVKIFGVDGVPKYMLKNAAYKLPQAVGYDYSDGYPRAVAAEPTVAVNAETLSGHTFTPATAGLETVTYTVTGGQARDAVAYPVRIVDVGYGGELCMENYFYGEGVSTQAADGYIEATTDRDAQIDFVKPVDANFALAFSIDPLKKNFGRLTVTVRDSADATQAIAMTFYRNATGTAEVSINGGKRMPTDGSWNGNGKSWEVSFDALLKNLKIDRFVNRTLDDVSFASGRVEVSFALEDVTGAAALRVEKINNQSVNNGKRDSVRPQVTILGKVAAAYAKGDVVTVPAAVATDVLDPIVTFSLRATAPDGSTLWSDSGRELLNADPTQSYTFTATQFGQYNVVLTATDASNRTQTTRYAVNVADKTAPIITTEKPLAKTGTVGQRVAVPKATVTDDSGEAIAYYVYLIRPDGVSIRLFQAVTDADGKRVYNEDGTPKLEYYDGFVPASAGVWTVQYYAADATGNTAIDRYDVRIDEE